MKFKSLITMICAAVALLSSVCVSAQDSNGPDPTIGQLLAGALAKKSASFSYKSGDIYREISNVTRSNEPVLVRFVYVKSLEEKDCFRIRLVIAQDKVPKKDGSLLNFEQIQEFNTCVDGSNPKIGRDEKVIKAF
jgi:hypothetical protein